MFFGLNNSPSAFQHFMNETFADYIAQGWFVIYMDDLLIYSTTLEEHHEHQRLILKRLKDANLFLKLSKCTFDATTIEYLGMIIRHKQVEMDPVKVKGITDCPTPKNVKDICTFLGFCNFYRRFISHFASIVKPLTNLTRKDVQWIWEKDEEETFQHLKAAFVSSSMLLIPDRLKPFRLLTDASLFTVGAILEQKDDNGDWRPCGYYSHGLNNAE